MEEGSHVEVNEGRSSNVGQWRGGSLVEVIGWRLSSGGQCNGVLR